MFGDILTEWTTAFDSWWNPEVRWTSVKDYTECLWWSTYWNFSHVLGLKPTKINVYCRFWINEHSLISIKLIFCTTLWNKNMTWNGIKKFVLVRIKYSAISRRWQPILCLWVIRHYIWEKKSILYAIFTIMNRWTDFVGLSTHHSHWSRPIWMTRLLQIS